MTRAVSIYLPGWPIWLARRRNKSQTRGAAANNGPPEAWLLWTAERGGDEVTYCCARARAAGVRAGMSLGHARSLLGGVLIRESPAEPAEDASALRRLGRWLLRYAPVVAADEPDGLMLDIAGCERLFGGERAHVRRIGEALGRFGLRARMAVAPTFAAAWALARYGQSEVSFIEDVVAALGPLPIAALRIEERTLEALGDVGVLRIEQLMALPRDELAARFGSALLKRLDQATGAAGETIRAIQLARRFGTAHVFDGPVKRVEIVEVTTRELLSRLVEQLQSAGRGIVELKVTLRRAGTGPEQISLRLSYPSRDMTHLWKLLSPKLERAHLGFGVEEISLRAERTQRMSVRQAAFLRETARDGVQQPAELAALVDCLMDRLGEGAVTRVEPAASFIPERAFVHTGAGALMASAKARGGDEAPSVYPVHRPSQLLETPEAARVLSLVPDGPPIWIEWREQAGEIVARNGPERIVFPWWMAGMTTASRDYYEVEDEHGRDLWVFRDIGSGRWFVHGQWT